MYRTFSFQHLGGNAIIKVRTLEHLVLFCSFLISLKNPNKNPGKLIQFAGPPVHTYPALPCFRVAVTGMSIALTSCTQPKVDTSARAGETNVTILEGQKNKK